MAPSPLALPHGVRYELGIIVLPERPSPQNETKIMKDRALCLFFCLLTLLATAPAQAEHDMAVVIQTIDEMFRSASSHATVEMKIVTPDWERTLEMELWTQGMDKTFIRLLSPRKEKGVGTLRIDKEMWNYLPKVGKTIKVPPSMMASAWMGSDFSNDDLVSEVSFVRDYDHEFLAVEGDEGLLHIRSVPHDGVPVVWGSVVTAVEEDGYLPVWERYYDEKDRLMRSFIFTEPRTFGKRRIPAVLTVIPENKKGNRTVMTYREIEFDIEIDDDTFTLRHLRSTK